MTARKNFEDHIRVDYLVELEKVGNACAEMESRFDSQTEVECPMVWN